MGKHFSLKKIRHYLRNRKPLAAADVDGWRGREHLAWMFINDDTEFQELIRTEFLLLYLTNEFLQIYICVFVCDVVPLLACARVLISLSVCMCARAAVSLPTCVFG